MLVWYVVETHDLAHTSNFLSLFHYFRWDVTLAILSRKQLLLPLSYLETLMGYDDQDDWTFFELNGCPVELVMSMARLASLASTYEKVHALEWVTFDTFPVEQEIDRVQNWINPNDATAETIAQTNKDPDLQRNSYHCTEAWRHAILLYAHRVFYRPQTPARLRSITHLSRVVLDHVRCIPDTAIVQKQTLLPVFLAAAEVGDEDEATRSFVRRYCAHWSSTSRYSSFGTVAGMLERVWADWHVETRQSYWWGVKIGGRSSGGGGGHNPDSAGAQHEALTSEFLLG